MTRVDRAEQEPIEVVLTLLVDGMVVSYRIMGRTLAEIEKQWPIILSSAAGELAARSPTLL